MRKALQLGPCILIGAAAFWAMLLSGCGPQGGGLALKIYFTDPETGPSINPLRGEDPLGEGQAPPYITDFRICVSAADMGKPKCKNFNLTDYEKKQKARMDDLPVGSERKVTFQGYDFEDLEVHWCGEVHDIEIKKDATTRVSMYISGCSNFTAVRTTMGTPRVFHTATKLPDGRVLVAGGFYVATGTDSMCPGGACVHLTATESVDIYNPLTGSFDSESGLQLTHARGLHTATLLSDGRVFIAGGCEKALWRVVDFPNGPAPVVEVDADQGGFGTAGSTAEIINPATGMVEELQDPLPTSRALHGDILHPGGDVLLLGGTGPAGNEALRSMVRYSPADGSFEEIADAMSVPRQSMLLVPYGNNAFLIWGGNHPPLTGAGIFAETLTVENNEIFIQQPQFVDPDAWPWQGLPSFYSAGARLPSGEVLITGGMLTDKAKEPSLLKPRVMQEYRVLNMGNEIFTRPETAANTMGYLFAFHSVNLLRNGKVLIAGGVTSLQSPSWFSDPQEKAIFYYPLEDEENAFGIEQIGGSSVVMYAPRAGHSATELDDGTILLAGGFTGKGSVVITDTAELYNPAPRVLRIE
jgi:hypothetical protein